MLMTCSLCCQHYYMAAVKLSRPDFMLLHDCIVGPWIVSLKPFWFAMGFKSLDLGAPLCVKLIPNDGNLQWLFFSILPRISECPCASRAHPVGGSMTVFHAEYPVSRV